MLAIVHWQHPLRVLESIYYISKGQKTVGPCTLDDLYSYIAYGSVRESDLVRREGTSAWEPLSSLEELQLEAGDQARDITSRRRTARYRDYAKVPQNRRAGVILGQLIWGFLLFPPLLWKAAIAIFQDRIYSSQKDAKGYLLFWPRWVEFLVSGLLVVNGLIWATLIWLVWKEAFPVAREMTKLFSTGINDLQDWLGK